MKLSHVNIFIAVVYEIFTKFECILSPLKNISWYFLRLYPYKYFIFILIHKIWWFFCFIIILHVITIFHLNRMTYSSFDTFSTICNVSTSVDNLNSTTVTFNVAYHGNRSKLQKWIGYSLHLSVHLSQKFSNASTNQNVWSNHEIFMLNHFQVFFECLQSNPIMSFIFKLLKNSSFISQL